MSAMVLLKANGTIGSYRIEVDDPSVVLDVVHVALPRPQAPHCRDLNGSFHRFQRPLRSGAWGCRGSIAPFRPTVANGSFPPETVSQSAPVNDN
jgi:hypothetical protein